MVRLLVKHILAALFALSAVLMGSAVLLLASSFLSRCANAAGAHTGSELRREQHPILRIAVIDTGLDLSDIRFAGQICPDGNADFTGEGLVDTLGHGTHVAGLITKHAGLGRYCLQILKYYSPNQTGSVNLARLVQAFRAARGADFVNFSGGGPEPSASELAALRALAGATLVFAAGNEGRDLREEPYFPASYGLPNAVVVGNWGKDFLPAPGSNFGPQVGAWEVGTDVVSTLPKGKTGRMSGASQATAIRTGKLVRAALTGARSTLGSCDLARRSCFAR